MAWPGVRYGGRGGAMPLEVRAAIRWSVASGVTWKETASRFEVTMRTVARTVREVGGMAPMVEWSRPAGGLSPIDRERILRGIDLSLIHISEPTRPY